MLATHHDLCMGVGEEGTVGVGRGSSQGYSTAPPPPPHGLVVKAFFVCSMLVAGVG